MVITGYKYTNEQEAIDARETCDAYYGIHVNPDDVTQNWVDYQTAEYDTPIFWYIVFDESIRIILGEPSIFEITTLPIEN